MTYHLYLAHSYYVGPILKSSDYDISTLASQIEHFTSIESQPGKLSFVLEKDPNNLLEISEGDMVEFVVSEGLKNYNVFKGYVFTVGTDSTEAYMVTAYDQTRYLKNKDTMVVKEMTINTLFEDVCKRNNLKKYISKSISQHFLPSKIYNDKSYFDILEEGITDTLINSPIQQYFFIKDNFGVLELDELRNHLTDYVIGDESLLTDYQYEVDIDKDTYNKIKIVKTDKTGNLSIDVLIQDEKSINKIGVLRKVLNYNETLSPAQAVSKANLFIQLKKNANKKITLNAIGVPDLNAGDGFLLQLDKLQIKQPMWITSAVHHYDSDTHTMDLEVSGLINKSIKGI